MVFVLAAACRVICMARETDASNRFAFSFRRALFGAAG
jgi:hypothetical protein